MFNLAVYGEATFSVHTSGLHVHNVSTLVGGKTSEAEIHPLYNEDRLARLIQQEQRARLKAGGLVQTVPIDWAAILTSDQMMADKAAQWVELFIRKIRRYESVDLQTVRDNPIAWASLIAEAEIGLWKAIEEYRDPLEDGGSSVQWIRTLVAVRSGFRALDENPWPPAPRLLYEKHVAFGQGHVPLPAAVINVRKHIAQKIGRMHGGHRFFSASVGWTPVEEEIAKDYAIEIVTINHGRGWLRPARKEHGDLEVQPTQIQGESARQGPFDGIMLFTSIGYMDLDQVLSECRVALRPGGVIYYTDVLQEQRPAHWPMWWWRSRPPEQHIKALHAHGFIHPRIEDLSFAEPGLFHVSAEVPSAASDGVSKKN